MLREGKPSRSHRQSTRCGNLRAAQFESLESRQLLDGEGLLITEFMATNATTLRDRFREYPDWIEVHNPTDSPVALTGWSLTDAPDALQKWSFPAGVELAAHGYLVVFASGNNLVDPASALHTNFQLNKADGYLALVRPDQTVAYAYAPAYPEQYTDVSYGIRFRDGVPLLFDHTLMVKPTPGAANDGEVVEGKIDSVKFSVERGFYTTPVTVELRTAQPQAIIRYTTDSSTPTPEHGEIYTSPLTITTTTPLRAIAYQPGMLPSDVSTTSYIFLDDVLKQTGEGLPKEWGYFDDQGPPRPARMPANYAMDPRVANNPLYRDTIRDDLRSLPTLSITMDPNDLWDFTNGIYSNPERRGDAWERPASLEYMNEQGQTLFEANAGLRVHGGWARRFTFNAKLSFRVAFRSKYGPSTLDYPMFGEGSQDVFQQLVLRGGFNDSWQTGDRNNTYMQDFWTRQTQLEMGGYAAKSRYVHLYLNGLYWGMYSPTERPDAFWAAYYRGGKPEEYDVINTGGSVIDGNSRAWSELVRTVARNPINYEEVKKQIDIDQFIDYLIVNQYVGNWDWPHNNWYASRHRVEGGKWLFHSWDAEAAFQNGITEDRVNNATGSVGPADIYLKLKNVAEFQSTYADRVTKHFTGNGLLTPQANIDRLNRIAAQIDRAIVGESVRWGDGRVNSGTPLTRDSAWIPRIRELTRTYFPRRGDAVIAQFRKAKLMSPLDAPLFNPPSGRVAPSTNIALTAPDGDIYYTTDGTDPRAADGTISPNARNLNSINLVSRSSRSRWRIARADGVETSWMLPGFDDANWVPGLAAFGFDTGEADDPLVVQDGFRVRQVVSSVRLNTLEEADKALAGENVTSSKEFTKIPVLNYLDGASGGFFEGSQQFPGGGGDSFVIDAQASVTVNRTGIYTFGVSSNDSARLEIDGQVVFADATRHGADAISWATVELAKGQHTLRLVMFDRLATAVLELFYAPGTKTAFDDSFALLGDRLDRPFAPLFDTDVKDLLAGKATAVEARIPFRVENLGLATSMPLKFRTLFDDGFVAYLNGVEVARRAAPDDLSATGTATAVRFDADVVQVQSIDLSEHRSLLREGDNVLAVKAWNSAIDDPDLLFQPRLVLQDPAATFQLTSSATAKARLLLDGAWSPLSEGTFQVAVPASRDNLRIAEIHYHPGAATEAEQAAGFQDADEFEFVELVNIGSQTIDLSDLRFARLEINGAEQGVEFDFAHGAVRELAAGARLVVVENVDAFRQRYGQEIVVAGEWSGGLDNRSETITLQLGSSLLQQISYDSRSYAETAGLGASLEFYRANDVALEDWGQLDNWRPSIKNGTPGRGPTPNPGDINGDGRFSSEDLVLLGQRGEFEDGIAGNSDWLDGDFDGDGDVTTSDLVFAFTYSLFSDRLVPAEPGDESSGRD